MDREHAASTNRSKARTPSIIFRMGERDMCILLRDQPGFASRSGADEPLRSPSGKEGNECTSTVYHLLAPDRESFLKSEWSEAS